MIFIFFKKKFGKTGFFFQKKIVLEQQKISPLSSMSIDCTFYTDCTSCMSGIPYTNGCGWCNRDSVLSPIDRYSCSLIRQSGYCLSDEIYCPPGTSCSRSLMSDSCLFFDVLTRLIIRFSINIQLFCLANMAMGHLCGVHWVVLDCNQPRRIRLGCW
jgi:hypothetical protein